MEANIEFVREKIEAGVYDARVEADGLGPVPQAVWGWLNNGKDFVLREAPEMVQDLVVWKRAESLLVIGALLAAFVFCCWRYRRNTALGRKALALGNTQAGEEMKTVGAIYAIASVACLPAALVAMGCYLQVWLAPKVYTLEHFARLLAG